MGSLRRAKGLTQRGDPIAANEVGQVAWARDNSGNAEALQLVATTKELMVSDATSQAKLEALKGFVDGVEGLLSTLTTAVNAVASAVGTVDTHVDGLEALAGTANSALSALQTAIGTMDTHVDGLEALVAATNTAVGNLLTAVGSMDTHVDGVETLIAATNTLLSTLNSAVQTPGQKTKDNSISFTLASNDDLLARVTDLLALFGLAQSTPDPITVLARIKDLLQPIIDLKTMTVLAAGANEIGRVYQRHFIQTSGASPSSIQRTADANDYAIGDNVGNDPTAGNIVAHLINNVSDTVDHPVDIVGVSLETTDTKFGNALVRLHLFRSDPHAGSVGDNAPWTHTRAGYLGYFQGFLVALSDGARGDLAPAPNSPGLKMVLPVSGGTGFYWELQVMSAIVAPTSGATFTATLRGWQGRPS
jgi:hypothetical protein